jgi:hypothetical protein
VEVVPRHGRLPSLGRQERTGLQPLLPGVYADTPSQRRGRPFVQSALASFAFLATSASMRRS